MDATAVDQRVEALVKRVNTLFTVAPVIVPPTGILNNGGAHKPAARKLPAILAEGHYNADQAAKQSWLRRNVYQVATGTLSVGVYLAFTYAQAQGWM